MGVPLIVGALIDIVAPEFLKIGGFTTALATGATAIIGVFVVWMGAEMDFKVAPESLKVGTIDTFVKFAWGVGVGLLVAEYCGHNGLWGISSLAIIYSMTNSNGGLYAALTSHFGEKSEVGAIAMLSLNDGPVLTMVALGTAGIATVPYEKIF